MTMASGGAGRPVLVSSLPHGAAHFPGTPVPMKLFATWEVERTPPNCIPRLCSLTLTRLALLRSLDSDLTSIIVAVKMQNSKRTLRSNEIPLPSVGLLDTVLDLTFSLQYPHFLKREGNQLQIMLRRRKKYKNRTILGYKTLAVGIINMGQVLQRQMDLELELVEGKAGGQATVSVLGKITMQSLSSQPVDHEDLGKQIDTDRVELDSDEEEDFSSPDEGSDSEPHMEDIRASNPGRRKSHKGLSNSAARQRNLRQKFVALLRRFKVNEPEDLRALNKTEQDSQMNDVDPEEFEAILDELEYGSDYGPDLDTTSVGSTPKPSLRPFFSSSRSLIREALDNPGQKGQKGYSILEKPEMVSDHMSDDSSKGALSDSHPETLTDPEHSDVAVTSSPPHSGDEVKNRAEQNRRSKLFMKDKSGGFSVSIKQTKSMNTNKTQNQERLERMNSANNFEASSPRKVLLEQLSRILPADDSLPDQVILANTGDPQASHLASKLSDIGTKVICTAGPADVRATLTCLVTRLQKFCNTNIAPPNVTKVGLVGSDSFLNSMIRPYVELMSGKPPDWQNHLLFYVIPLGSNCVSRGIAARCPLYSKLFHDDSWRELLDKPEPTKAEVAEFVGRVSQYLALSCSTQLSIAEAMVTYKEKLTDEESCQVFVPFVSDVKVGAFSSDQETEEFSLSSSFGHGANPFHDRKSPPSSPNISKHTFDKFLDKDLNQKSEELMELQLDYWGVTATEKTEKLFGTKNENGDRKQDTEKSKKQADPKSSIKTTFRNLSIQHLPTSPILTHSPDGQHSFSMTYTTKEKKPKAVLKIGKKKPPSGETDAKSQTIDGISRLICMTKSNHPLKVAIDGHEWSGVKFFQLSSQWQTHIKYLPVALGTACSPAEAQF
jgi:hypothetical protein